MKWLTLKVVRNECLFSSFISYQFNVSVNHNCGWSEDQLFANKLNQLWPNIKINNYWRKLSVSKRPSSKSYFAVDKAVGVEFTVAKFSFFRGIASLLQPYLSRFQTIMPMLPYLGKTLERLHRNLFILL